MPTSHIWIGIHEKGAIERDRCCFFSLQCVFGKYWKDVYELDRPSSYWTANGINIGYRKIWIWLDHVCERHTSVFKIVSQCWWLVTKTNKLLKSYQRIEGGTKKLWTNGFFHAQPKHEGYFQRHGNLMSLVTFLGSLENTRKKYWKRNETFMWFMSLRCRFSHAQTTNDLFNFYESGYFSDGKRHKYFSKYLSSIIHFSQSWKTKLTPTRNAMHSRIYVL